MGKKLINRIVRLLPGYGWVSFLVVALIQGLVYWATRVPLAHMEKLDLSTPLDALVPFQPVWISVYVLSFVSWGVTLVLLFRQRRDHVYRNTSAYILTLLLTGALFLLLPAAIERPEVPGRDFFSWLTRLIYSIDQPNNLCPSLHVISSYYCWRCLYGTEGIPRWYRRFNFVFLLLVCACILFVKQHLFVDIPTAVLAAEIPLQLAKRFRWERVGFAVEGRLRR